MTVQWTDGENSIVPGGNADSLRAPQPPEYLAPNEAGRPPEFPPGAAAAASADHAPMGQADSQTVS